MCGDRGAGPSGLGGAGANAPRLERVDRVGQRCGLSGGSGGDLVRRARLRRAWLAQPRTRLLVAQRLDARLVPPLERACRRAPPAEFLFCSPIASTGLTG